MKGSLGRRVLLLAPLAPLLAAPTSVLAVPSVEDKRNADREKVARHIRPALLKNSQDKVIYIVEFNQQRIADQKDDAKVAQIRENKPEMEGGLDLTFSTFVLAVILLPLALLPVVGVLDALTDAMVGEENSTDGAAAGGGSSGGLSQCDQRRPPPTHPTRLAQRPAPPAVMSTRKGPSRLSTSTDQLNAVYNKARWKRWDAEAVWLMCPTISNEAARRLGADWSLVGEMMRQHLINDEFIRELAEEAVREDPGSPALYLHASWWACIREVRESGRELQAAEEETPPDHARVEVARARERRARDAYDASQRAISREFDREWIDKSD